MFFLYVFFFFFKQKTAYEMRISDWSSDVCSSDLVERIDDRGQQHLGHVALDDLAREAFGDGGLADAGIAHIERVVLAAAAQDLDRAVDFGAAADQRIDLAALRLLVEVDGELVERGFLLALGLALVLRLFLLLGLGLRGGLAALAEAVAEDRKSTRLNSSH